MSKDTSGPAIPFDEVVTCDALCLPDLHVTHDGDVWCSGCGGDVLLMLAAEKVDDN